MQNIVVKDHTMGAQNNNMDSIKSHCLSKFDKWTIYTSLHKSILDLREFWHI